MGATELAPGHQQVQVDKVPDVPSLEPGQWLPNLPIFLLFNTLRPPFAAFFCVSHWKEQDFVRQPAIGRFLFILCTCTSTNATVENTWWSNLVSISAVSVDTLRRPEVSFLRPWPPVPVPHDRAGADVNISDLMDHIRFTWFTIYAGERRRRARDAFNMQAGIFCFDICEYLSLVNAKRAICLWVFQVLWFGKPLRQELHFAHGSWIFQELLFGDALAQRDFSDPSVEGALGPEFIYNAKTASPRRIGFSRLTFDESFVAEMLGSYWVMAHQPWLVGGVVASDHNCESGTEFGSVYQW